jgi:hypothetical protein
MIRGASEDQPFSAIDMGFDFAFGLNQPLDPSIGFFTVRYISQTLIGSERVKTKTTLGFS